MVITKATIVAAINQELYSGNSLVTVETATNSIRKGLKWLSKQGKWPCLYREAVEADNATLIAGTKKIALPANFRLLNRIILNDSTYDYAPLTLTTFNEILKAREYESSSAYSRPLQYVEKGGYFHLSPTSDGAYTAKFHFWRNHPDQNEILFSDDFEDALNSICIMKHLMEKGRAQKAGGYLQLAQMEVADLRTIEDTEFGFVEHEGL